MFSILKDDTLHVNLRKGSLKKKSVTCGSGQNKRFTLEIFQKYLLCVKFFTIYFRMFYFFFLNRREDICTGYARDANLISKPKLKILNQNRTNGVILVFILGKTLYFVVSSSLGVKTTPLKFPNRRENRGRTNC